jgi:methionyl-tRNA synthetase
MYVWVDALATYLSGLGFPETDSDYSRFWPADVHIIGKDIVRFHAVYWPALLMSAGLPLPQKIFGHGFLLARGGEKMSKSLGNVVDPIELAEKYGVDQLRYFFLREVSFGQDGSYSAEAIVTRCNAELANGFGNLAQRTLSQIFKNMDGRLVIHDMSQSDVEFCTKISILLDKEFGDHFNNLQLSQAIECWMQAVSACNQFIDEQAPWTLKKTDPDRMQAVLMVLFRVIRELAIYIQPIVPEAAGILLDQMGVPKNERDKKALLDVEWLWRAIHERNFVLAAPVGIFPRLEIPSAEEG